MKKIVRLGTFLILLSLISCGGKKNVELVTDKFPVEESLDTICTVVPEYSEHMTNSFNRAGDYFVSVNYKSPFAFSAYDSNLNLADTVVRIGHGHEEMMSPVYFGQWEGDPSDPRIIVYDDNSKILAGVNVAPFKGIATIADLSREAQLSPSRIFLMPDSTCVGINLPLGEQTRLFRYDLKSGELTYAPDNLEFGKEEAFYTSQCGLAVSEGGDRIVTAYTSVPVICIVDKDFNLVRKVYIGSEIDTKTFTSDERQGGFIDVRCVGDKIAALYADPAGMEHNRLMVFSKDGDPIASYAVGKSIGFCFDSSLSRLLSLNYDDEAGLMKIYVYAAPASIK